MVEAGSALTVTHVIASAASRYGGPPRFVKDACRALAHRGHDITLVTTDLDGPDRLDAQALQNELGDEVQLVVSRVRRPRGYAFSPALVRIIHRAAKRSDLIHIHGVYQFHTVAAAAMARRLKKPYVLHIHGALTRYHSSQKAWKKRPYEVLVERANIEGAQAVIQTTRAESESFEERFDNARGVIVPYAVDPALFSPFEGTNAAGTFEHLHGEKVITFLGRLSEKKGLDLLVDAFAYIAGEHQTAHLVIAGPDDEGIGQSLARQVAARGLQDRVSLVGLVTGSAKHELLSRSNVFVLPSVDESFGIAVAEALACGVPVVVSKDVALSAELLESGAGTVSERAPLPLAHAIERILRDAAYAESLSRAGERLASSRFTVAALSAQLESVYRGVVDKADAEAAPGRDPTS